MTTAGVISRTSHCRPLRYVALMLLMIAVCGVRTGTAAASSLDLTISGTPATTVTAGEAYSFTPTVSGLPAWYYKYFPYHAFTITNKPAWATFNDNTGALTGTPTSSEVGTFAGIIITVSKTAGSVSLPAFSIQVTSANTASSAPSTPPTIAGTPPTSVTVGSSYSFEPSATDSNGDALSFSVANKPSWASFSIATGELSGTPTSADVGTDSGITISVSDGTASAALPAFSITVAAAPTSPPVGTTNTGENVMGINSLADLQYTPYLDGFPLFKNRVREGSGFGMATSWNTPVALNSAGWPTADFQIVLYNGIQQSWGVGNFACGFIGSGSETVSAVNAATVSDVSHGSGGDYTTFTLASTIGLGGSANFGFKVTGTSGAVTDIYCYLPEYNSLSGIDNPTSPSAFTTEAVDFYKQFAWMRLMWYSNSLYNTTQMSSSNRHTASNTQTQTLGLNGGYTTYSLTGNPGSTSATLSSPWPLPSGNYSVVFSTSGGNQARNIDITQGSTSLSWSSALSGGNAATAIVGGEGAPIEWMIGLANATGTMGLWINLPAWEDGTDGEPGSYSTAILQLLASSYTSSGKVFFERGNENFWNGYWCTDVLRNLEAVGTGGYSDAYDYMAAGAHTFANLARANLPSGWWGTKAFQVEGQQAASGGGPYWTGDYLQYLKTRSGGTPSNDVQYIAIAPYVNPSIGSSDSMATIEANAQTWPASEAGGWGAEQTDIVARSYGLKMLTYEGGIQWNMIESSNTNSNVAAALADAGMAPAIEDIYQQYANLGFQGYSHFGAGVFTAPGFSAATAPINAFSTNYSTLIDTPTASPTLLGIQPFEGGQTVTRNVVAASGATIPGYDFADNVNNTNDCALNNSSLPTTPALAYFSSGYCLYRVWNPNSTAATYSLVVTFSGLSGSPTTNLVVNGTTAATSVAVTTGAATIGSVTLEPGDNFIALGKNGTQTATITQLQFN